jgi:hypothetical protein
MGCHFHEYGASHWIAIFQETLSLADIDEESSGIEEPLTVEV